MPAPQVDRIEQGPLTCWRIRQGDAELLVAEQGAQVLSYRRGDAPPIIWLSEEATFERGQSVRGGIPVCWPWFGDLARNPQDVQAMRQADTPAPAHGHVRNLDWQLDGIDAQGEATTLAFSFDTHTQPLPGWPHAVSLRLEIRLDDALHLALSTTNHGDHPVAFSQALHSYFAVSNVRQVYVEGLAGRSYIETLEGWEQRQQQGDLRFTGETDRIYLDLPDTLTLVDPSWQRRIVLRTEGSRSAVLWNPWIDKAQRLSSFADDAWQRMVCIETANVMGDRIELAPGGTQRLALSLDSAAD